MFLNVSNFYPCWYKLQWFTKPNRSIDGGFRDFWNWHPWKLEEIIQLTCAYIQPTGWLNSIRLPPRLPGKHLGFFAVWLEPERNIEPTRGYDWKTARRPWSLVSFVLHKLPQSFPRYEPRFCIIWNGACFRGPKISNHRLDGLRLQSAYFWFDPNMSKWTSN